MHCHLLLGQSLDCRLFQHPGTNIILDRRWLVRLLRFARNDGGYKVRGGNLFNQQITSPDIGIIESPKNLEPSISM